MPTTFARRVAAGQMGDAGEDGIGRLDQPCLWTDVEDVLDEGLEEAQLEEVDPEGFVVHHVEAAAVPVAERPGDAPPLEEAAVGCRQGCVDHEVGAGHRLRPVGAARDLEIGAELACIALEQRVHRRQPSAVDVHQVHDAAGKAWSQTEVADELQRELCAPGADQRELHSTRSVTISKGR